MTRICIYSPACWTLILVSGVSYHVDGSNASMFDTQFEEKMTNLRKLFNRHSNKRLTNPVLVIPTDDDAEKTIEQLLARSDLLISDIESVVPFCSVDQLTELLHSIHDHAVQQYVEALEDLGSKAKAEMDTWKTALTEHKNDAVLLRKRINVYHRLLVRYGDIKHRVQEYIDNVYTHTQLSMINEPESRKLVAKVVDIIYSGIANENLSDREVVCEVIEFVGANIKLQNAYATIQKALNTCIVTKEAFFRLQGQTYDELSAALEHEMQVSSWQIEHLRSRLDKINRIKNKIATHPFERIVENGFMVGGVFIKVPHWFD